MIFNLRNIFQKDVIELTRLHSRTFACDSNVLITGASGLIGVNMLSFFLSPEMIERRIVTTVDTRTSESKKFIEKIFTTTQPNYINLDLIALTEPSRTEKFDYIFHLASYGQPSKFMQNSCETLELNSIGLIKISKMLAEGGRLFFASSSEVYVGNQTLPHVESECGVSTPTHPRACYIEGKRFGETYCHELSKTGVRAYSGRISLAYGPGFRSNDQRVMNQFIINALSSGRILMLDKGLARRTYCYVADTVDIIFRLIHSEFYKPINIAGTTELTIRDLAEKIGTVTGAEVVAGTSDSGMSGAPLHVYSSPVKAKDILAKDTFVPIDEGLNRTVCWARALLEA